ncbi:MAG: type II toxin-antitoxin system RelE/ParE family toxin [Deltaproteobacteria bacterium]|nr:type II toxin-antitoxin system RelE/ParE family toxin [Deltaproteobacteria bacterium]
MRVVVAPEAHDDLRNILEWIGRHQPAAAVEQVDRVLTAIDGLREFPMMGKPGRVEGTREFVVTGTPFIVAYEVRDALLAVLRVRHGRQRWPMRI